ncbi:MAG: hypothetical protein HYU64_01110 [Armatimonadetes bacterium]|nr:hypothetical protein [Armatimonadota bacterium]
MGIECPQCGAVQEVSAKENSFPCSFCGASLYFLIDQAVQHFWFRPTLKKHLVPGIIGKWLDEKELRNPFSVLKSEKFFFPMWFLYLKDGGLLKELGAPTPFLELKDLPTPRGDMQAYRPEDLDGETVIPPGIRLDSILDRRFGEQTAARLIKARLCHIPVYHVVYSLGEQTFSAIVDAVQGEVIAGDSPKSPSKSKDKFYGYIMFGAMALFFFQGLLIPGFLNALFLGGISAGVLALFLSDWLSKRGRVQ